MQFQPSKYQQNVFDFIENGRGDLVIEAVAGSGKTTTLVQASKLVNGRSLFLAFNKHIAETLKDRMPNFECKTIHSLGYWALRNNFSGSRLPKLNNYKYWDIADSLIEDVAHLYTGQQLKDMKHTLIRMCNLYRLRLVKNTNDLMNMIDHYAIDYYGPELLMVETAISRGNSWFDNAGAHDFTDMLYLPVSRNWKITGYDFIFVDEAQDLSPVQLQMALKARSLGGRMVFVGDTRQSIMGFAGADSDSIPNIIKATNAKVLPLSICYRCPTSHLDLARTIVPQIEDRENCPEGQVIDIDFAVVSHQIKINDLIICRMTAPLVTLCLKLIGQQLPARVKGQEIGKGLIDVIKKTVKTDGYVWEKFLTYLNIWAANQIDKLENKKNTAGKISSIINKVDALEAAYLGSDCADERELIGLISSIFSDKEAAIWLSTVHRAKGMEADRVFILHPEKLPLIWETQQEWETVQEYNIKYVALTRAKKELYFIRE